MITDHTHTNPHWPLDWVLVANASRARIFERDPDNGALREVADHVHPASRQKGSDLGTDRPGQVHKSGAATAFDAHTPAHEREQLQFARELAQVLESAALAHRMPGLVLLASNPFLGALKAQLGDAAQLRLKLALPIDLTSFVGAELEHRVSHALRSKA